MNISNQFEIMVVVEWFEIDQPQDANSPNSHEFYDKLGFKNINILTTSRDLDTYKLLASCVEGNYNEMRDIWPKVIVKDTRYNVNYHFTLEELSEFAKTGCIPQYKNELREKYFRTAENKIYPTKMPDRFIINGGGTGYLKSNSDTLLGWAYNNQIEVHSTYVCRYPQAFSHFMAQSHYVMGLDESVYKSSCRYPLCYFDYLVQDGDKVSFKRETYYYDEVLPFIEKTLNEEKAHERSIKKREAAKKAKKSNKVYYVGDIKLEEDKASANLTIQAIKNNDYEDTEIVTAKNYLRNFSFFAEAGHHYLPEEYDKSKPWGFVRDKTNNCLAYINRLDSEFSHSAYKCDDRRLKGGYSRLYPKVITKIVAIWTHNYQIRVLKEFGELLEANKIEYAMLSKFEYPDELRFRDLSLSNEARSEYGSIAKLPPIYIEIDDKYSGKRVARVSLVEFCKYFFNSDKIDYINVASVIDTSLGFSRKKVAVNKSNGINLDQIDLSNIKSVALHKFRNGSNDGKDINIAKMLRCFNPECEITFKFFNSYGPKLISKDILLVKITMQNGEIFRLNYDDVLYAYERAFANNYELEKMALMG